MIVTMTANPAATVIVLVAPTIGKYSSYYLRRIGQVSNNLALAIVSVIPRMTAMTAIDGRTAPMARSGSVCHLLNLQLLVDTDQIAALDSPPAHDDLDVAE